MAKSLYETFFIMNNEAMIYGDQKVGNHRLLIKYFFCLASIQQKVYKLVYFTWMHRSL